MVSTFSESGFLFFRIRSAPTFQRRSEGGGGFAGCFSLRPWIWSWRGRLGEGVLVEPLAPGRGPSEPLMEMPTRITETR